MYNVGPKPAELIIATCYLTMYQGAFDHMVHFLVQRFSGALMLTTVVALCGFLAFGFEYSWLAALVFVLYLVPLSIFLTLLGMFLGASWHGPLRREPTTLT